MLWSQFDRKHFGCYLIMTERESDKLISEGVFVVDGHLTSLRKKPLLLRSGEKFNVT